MAHRRDGQGGLASLFAPALCELEARLRATAEFADALKRVTQDISIDPLIRGMHQQSPS
jgi:hypothetical protein